MPQQAREGTKCPAAHAEYDSMHRPFKYVRWVVCQISQETDRVLGSDCWWSPVPRDGGEAGGREREHRGESGVQGRGRSGGDHFSEQPEGPQGDVRNGRASGTAVAQGGDGPPDSGGQIKERMLAHEVINSRLEPPHGHLRTYCGSL